MRLVRLETKSARMREAKSLAGVRDISLDDWLSAMRQFGEFEEQPEGTRVETLELRVGKEKESTRLFVHVPVDYEPSQPAALLMAFHGTGGDGSFMINQWKAIAEKLAMVVVAPSEAGKNEGYEFSQRERDAALAAMRWARLEFNVDEDRIFATGVSRGGHLAWDLALRYPGWFAGIAPMIGSPRVQHRLGQNNIRYLENVADLPIRDLQGVGDHPGMIYNLEFVFERLLEYGASDAELFLQEGLGHSFRMSAVDWEAFFVEKRRDPFPGQVVRRVAREGEGRAYWVEVLETKKPVRENFEVPLNARWKKASNNEQRLIIQEQADKYTGRLAVNMSGVNAFEAKSERGIKRFRLLLPQRAFVEGEPLTVTWNRKKVRRRPKGDKELLLVEFAERFDRSFLPVAQVEIK
jgi:Putative esterase